MYHKVLRKYWGYDDFRPLQLDIIKSIMSGRDTLAVLPTGGGKSLTYQVPALCFDEGITLVISPLIALMHDQVENLKKRNIRTAFIHSGLTHHQILDLLEQCEFGAYRLLYVSPERLTSELFLKRLNFLNIRLVAVDEAHCISEWGYDFRPAYLRIAELRDYLPPDVPMLALTASATQKVIDDIVSKLRLHEHNFFTSGIDRPNLFYVVRETISRDDELVHILNHVPGTAIVYSRTRSGAEDLAKYLTKAGFSADFYHAGLKAEARAAKQEAWMKNETRILVATNAFGMGIDKADVRTVVHYDAPDALEQYYQEAGRAGRDGNRSYAVLLTSKSSLQRLEKRPSSAFPEKDFIRTVYQRLADFYIVGEGSGEGAIYPFDLERFCAFAHIQYMAAEAALKILEWSGYITITDPSENPSKLQILIPSRLMYEWRLLHPKYERLMETMLRVYTGIFTDLVHINEDYLAQLLGTTRREIYLNLSYLSSIGDVDYRPFSKSQLIIYNTLRFPAKDLHIPRHAYENRIDHTRERIQKMYDYAVNHTVCRQVMLNRYFNINDNTPCGHCDVCLSKKRANN